MTVELKPFHLDLVTDVYVTGINDPEVNEFSRRKDMPSLTDEDCFNYFRRDDSCHVAVFFKDRHVGNVGLRPANGSLELSIVLFDKTAWGQGVASEAIKQTVEFLGLDAPPIWSESKNPAFNKVMEKLGWDLESVTEGVSKWRLVK